MAASKILGEEAADAAVAGEKDKKDKSKGE